MKLGSRHATVNLGSNTAALVLACKISLLFTLPFNQDWHHHHHHCLRAAFYVIKHYENHFTNLRKSFFSAKVLRPWEAQHGQHAWHFCSLGQHVGPSMCTLYWHYSRLCVTGTKNKSCPRGTASVSQSISTTNWERERSLMSNWLDIIPCLCWSKVW